MQIIWNYLLNTFLRMKLLFCAEKKELTLGLIFIYILEKNYYLDNSMATSFQSSILIRSKVNI